MHLNGVRRLDPQAHLSAFHPEDNDPDIRTDGHTFAASSCQDQHERLPWLLTDTPYESIGLSAETLSVSSCLLQIAQEGVVKELVQRPAGGFDRVLLQGQVGNRFGKIHILSFREGLGKEGFEFVQSTRAAG